MVGVALALAVVSMLSNINTAAQIAGDADGLRMTRLTASQLVNSGVAWAGLMVLAGWLVKYPRQAAAAGVAAGLFSLAAHYAMGQAAGIYTGEIWELNLNWFLMATVAGAPLGLVGAAAHRADDVGLLARLMVPLGALAEPLVMGMFVRPAAMPWQDRFAGPVAGLLLTTAGALALVWLVVRERSARREAARQLGVLVERGPLIDQPVRADERHAVG